MYVKSFSKFVQFFQILKLFRFEYFTILKSHKCSKKNFFWNCKLFQKFLEWQTIKKIKTWFEKRKVELSGLKLMAGGVFHSWLLRFMPYTTTLQCQINIQDDYPIRDFFFHSRTVKGPRLLSKKFLSKQPLLLGSYPLINISYRIWLFTNLNKFWILLKLK